MENIVNLYSLPCSAAIHSSTVSQLRSTLVRICSATFSASLIARVFTLTKGMCSTSALWTSNVQSFIRVSTPPKETRRLPSWWCSPSAISGMFRVRHCAPTPKCYSHLESLWEWTLASDPWSGSESSIERPCDGPHRVRPGLRSFLQNEIYKVPRFNWKFSLHIFLAYNNWWPEIKRLVNTENRDASCLHFSPPKETKRLYGRVAC